MKSLRKKNIIQVELCEIIDRDNCVHDDYWKMLCEHHCIRMANGMMFTLEPYFSVPDKNGDWDDENYDNDFPKFILNYLAGEGVDYREFNDILIHTEW